jgi:hypothetical protein
MGWGKFFLLGDWGQQMDIQDQKQEIEDLRQQIELRANTDSPSGNENRIARLEKENAELRLYLAALINYLGRKKVLQRDEFRSLVEIIDAEDGQTDGKYHGDILPRS